MIIGPVVGQSSTTTVGPQYSSLLALAKPLDCETYTYKDNLTKLLFNL